MLSHNLKIAFRSLFRNKLFSIINILGLALGILTCLLIGQYVNFELSYDRFHKNVDRIYRVRHDRYMDGELQYQKAQAFIPTGEVLKNELPEVQAYTTLFRVSEQHDVIMTYRPNNGEAIHFVEVNVYQTKGKFQGVFSLDILEGSTEQETLLPFTMLISESTANKYFGDQSALGKTLTNPNLKSYKIVGVFKDFPKNSHFHIDFLLGWDSISGDENYDHNNWRWDAFYTYLLLAPEATAEILEAKFSEITDKYIGDQKNSTYSKFVLQPLTDIHLHSDLLGEIEPNGDAKIVYALMGLAIFILLIAWINYVNLSTSRSLDRSGEIGIRKAVGSTRKQIVKQFLTETFLTNLLAILITAVILLVLSFVTFSQFEISLELFTKVEFWGMVLFLLLTGSFLAGLFPAFISSSFKTVQALKGKPTSIANRSSLNLRYGLIVFQLAISIALIASVLVVNKQLFYMKTKSLGINMDNTLVINTHAIGNDSHFTNNILVLKNKLKGFPIVHGVSASYDIPGKTPLTRIGNFKHIKNPEELVNINFTRIDDNFIPEFEVDLLAGRNFKKGVDDQYSMIMNIEAINALGFENPKDAIGYEVKWGNAKNPGKAEIIGVVDYRTTSFKQRNYPMAYASVFFPFKYLSIKFNQLDNMNTQQNIEFVKSAWEEIFPETPFDFFFLDDFFNKQYQNEQQFSQLLFSFTVLAIFVACLGLYGSTTLIVSRRTKEVGVRKVLGAPIKSLLLLLSENFIFLVLIAGLLALPGVLIGINRWLESYPYRTPLNWWMLLLPIGLMMLITAITIGYQILRVSLSNPVKALRYE